MSEENLPPMVDFLEEDDDGEDDSSGAHTIDAFFQVNGIPQDAFNCVLRVYSHETHKYEHVKKIEGEIPDFDTIGLHYGPGKYSYFFTWIGKDGTSGRKKGRMKELKFVISEKSRDAHEKYLEEQRELREAETKKKLERKKQERELESAGKGPTSSAEEAKSMLKEVLTMAKDLSGFNRPPDNSLTTLLPIIMKQSENQMNMMLGLMTALIGQKNIQQIQQPTGQEGMMTMMQGFMNMTKEVIMLKKDLETEDEPESIADKIWGKVEMFLPQILQLANTAMQARASNPMNGIVEMAKNSKEFQEIKSNAGEAAKVIARLDAKYERADVDNILSLIGLTRPENIQAPGTGAPSNTVQ